MFSDDTTPIQLETLVELLRDLAPRTLDARTAQRLLQPDGLKKDGGDRLQSRHAIRAARELGLLQQEDESLELAVERKDKRSVREIVLAALDQRVLAGLEVEPYFALFYSYLLGLGRQAGDPKRNRTDWAQEFNAKIFGGQKQSNQFNSTKLSGLHRWLRYVGLGWYDPAGEFQCNPYERLCRALPAICGGRRKASSDEFMADVARTCPELDGGSIFRQAHPTRQEADRVCTLGLSHALVDLHLDGRIVLHCPQDSRGWSLLEADPLPLDNQTFRSGRMDFVEFPKGPVSR